jgi:hypothetical protein
MAPGKHKSPQCKTRLDYLAVGDSIVHSQSGHSCCVTAETFIRALLTWRKLDAEAAANRSAKAQKRPALANYII